MSIRLALAKALIAGRQADAAVAELQKAAELDPRNAETQNQLGYVNLFLRRNAAAAAAAYEKAVAAAPANTDYRTALGVAWNAAKQYDRAIPELLKVTQTPGYAKADAWIALGEALVVMRRYPDAVPVLEKGVALAPKNAQAAASLAWAYFGLKDTANFKKNGAKARALGYKEPTLLDYLSRVEAGQPIK